MKIEIAVFFALLASIGAAFLFQSTLAFLLVVGLLTAVGFLCSSSASERAKSAATFVIGMTTLILMGMYGRL